MSKNDMVMGEPVALPTYRRERKHNSHDWDEGHMEGWAECFEEFTKLGPLYTHSDPGEVERLRAENIRLIEDRARFPDRPDDIGCMITCHIGNLKNQAKSAEDYARKWRWELEAVSRKLDTANALLQEFCDRVDRGEVRSNKSYAKFKAHLSASAEPSANHSAEPDKKVEYELAGYEGNSGLYYSKLAAVANGEQRIEPIYRVKK